MILRFDSISRLLFDQPLAEGPRVRFIYMDEAGTSHLEPVRIVASIIVNADTELRILDKEINRVIKSAVPSSYQNDFWFHAKDVFSGGRYDRKTWNFDDRLDFYKEFINIPFLHNIPIALGCSFSGVTNYEKADASIIAKIDHLEAFLLCVERADYYLKEMLRGKETGTIVAENYPSMKNALTRLFSDLKKGGEITQIEQDKRLTRQHIAPGTVPGNVDYQVRNIVDVPHFVEKGYAPALQMADACAFAFCRCLAKQNHGDDLILAMLGPENGQYFLDEPENFRISMGGLFVHDPQKYT